MKKNNLVSLIIIMIVFIYMLFMFMKTGVNNPFVFVVLGVMALIVLASFFSSRKYNVKTQVKINQQEVLEYEKMINSFQELAPLRKKYRILSVISTILLLMLISLFVLHAGMVFIVLAFIAVFIVFFLQADARSHYTSIYKKEIIKGLVNKRGLEYFENGMTRHNYDQGLYEPYDRYSSDDLIRGAINNCYFELADVHTEVEREDDEGKTYYSTLFMGNVAFANLNRPTNALIDITHSGSGLIRGVKKVEIDNAEFEKLFNVYGNDAIQTMRFLTPDVTMSILDLRQLIGATFTMRVLNNVIYFRFYTGGLFEPHINNAKKEAEGIYFYFKMLDGIQNVIGSILKEMERFTDE